MKINEIADNALDAYYARNYYGLGRGYFDDPPETDEDMDFIDECPWEDDEDGDIV